MYVYTHIFYWGKVHMAKWTMLTSTLCCTNRFTVSYNHHLIWFRDISSPPKGDPAPLAVTSHPLSQPLIITDLLSVSVDVPGLFHRNWSYALWSFVSGFLHSAWCLQDLTTLYHMSCFILFYGWVIFHCVDGPHFVYLFFHWWTCKLFPLFGNPE